jgi:hypothetical protein
LLASHVVLHMTIVMLLLQAHPAAEILKQQVVHPIATIATEQAPETVAAVGLEARKTAAIIGQNAEPIAETFVNEQLL